MVEHLVLFRWKESAAAEAVDAALEQLLRLKDAIPGIVDLSCGRNFSERAKDYDAGLVVRFADRAGLDSYAVHPAHLRVLEDCLRPIMADVIALDYTF